MSHGDLAEGSSGGSPHEERSTGEGWTSLVAAYERSRVAAARKVVGRPPLLLVQMERQSRDRF
jgi:hypothetical protein